MGICRWFGNLSTRDGAYVEKIGKVPVIVQKDVPGFIANRVNAPAGVLVNSIINSGEIEPEALDAFVRSLGAPMGPCELLDYVGADIAAAAAVGLLHLLSASL